MIGAVCESPMTIRSIINWKDSIKEGTMLLRDIVDLEQTYDMSDVGDTKEEDTINIIEGDTEKKHLQTKENTKKEKLENNNKIKLKEDEIVVERDILILEDMRNQYHKKIGSYPSNIGELISAGFLKEIPREPFGKKYFIKEDHSIHSSVVKKRMELFID